MSFELILPFLRPIEPLLLDDSISEIMGNPDSSWWCERDGKMHHEDAVSFDAAKLLTGLEVIANQLGKKLDETLDRLVRPLNDALDYTGIRTLFRKYVLLFFLREMAERKRSFWGWTTDEWIETIERQKKVEYQHVIAVAYLLCGFSDLHRLSKNHIVYVVLARKVFGREYMKVVGDRVQSLLREWGYLRTGTLTLVLRTIFEGLLYKRSPHLDALTVEDLQAVVARRPPRTGSYCVVALSRVLASMGTVPEAMEIKRPVQDKKLSLALTFGVSSEWCRLGCCCRRGAREED